MGYKWVSSLQKMLSVCKGWASTSFEGGIFSWDPDRSPSGDRKLFLSGQVCVDVDTV